MSVSPSFFSPLRFFERTDSSLESALIARPTTESRYEFGFQILPSKRTHQAPKEQSRAISALHIIENFNSEPLFPGNGFILFNRTGRLIDVGAPLSALEAVGSLAEARPVLIRLARVRPTANETNRTQVQLVPMRDFSYQIDSSENFITWWQTVGRNFCDGVF